jgi:hypothetical protein
MGRLETLIAGVITASVASHQSAMTCVPGDTLRIASKKLCQIHCDIGWSLYQQE